MHLANSWRGCPQVKQELKNLAGGNDVHIVAKTLSDEGLLELKGSRSKNPGYELTGKGILLLSDGKDFGHYWQEKVEKAERESHKEQVEQELKTLQTEELRLKILTMKHVEKLDLVLRELYKHGSDGMFYSILNILIEIGSESNLHEAHIIGRRLKEEGYIVYAESSDSADAMINSHGIEYCESSSHIDNSVSILNYNYEYHFAKPGTQISMKHIRDLIRQSKLEEAITNLNKFPNAIMEQDTLDILWARLSRLRVETNRGVIASEEKDIRINQMGVFN